MLGSDNLESSDGINAIVAHKETYLVRQCRKCLREWPFDWAYCSDCAISLHGREITKQVIRLVPADEWQFEKGSLKAPAIYPQGFFLACEFQCDCGAPTPENFRLAGILMEIALGAITSRGGKPWVLPALGIVGYWPNESDNFYIVVRAATEILAQVGQNNRKASFGSRGTSLGVGVASSKSQRQSARDNIEFAFRLASLAQPNGGLVCEAVYSDTVERFDYRGVCPAVPKSEPLPEPVFKLIGAKAEISGTHQTAPDTIPMAGRYELLEMLDDCCREVAEGRLVALHLIGDPGIGKSRLLREWLSKTEREAWRNEWIRLHVYGVPYGGYPLRAWKHLVNSMTGAGIDSAPTPPPTTSVEDVITRLRRLSRPTLMIVDDLHWIDDPSRHLLASFLDDAANLPVFVILAYRPSFANEAPYRNTSVHRRVFVRELGRADLKLLIESIAAERATDLPREWIEEIIRKARGNPLYAVEAIGYLAEVGWNVSPESLPLSLPELLIQRIQRTLDLTLPRLDQEVRLCMSTFASIGDSKGTLRRLELLEEQVASWLDRFDVFQQEAPAMLKKFLRGLKAIDGTLALLNIFAGRQRSHKQRLAQGLARIEALNESPMSKG